MVISICSSRFIFNHRERFIRTVGNAYREAGIHTKITLGYGFFILSLSDGADGTDHNTHPASHAAFLITDYGIRFRIPVHCPAHAGLNTIGIGAMSALERKRNVSGSFNSHP